VDQVRQPTLCYHWYTKFQLSGIFRGGGGTSSFRSSAGQDGRTDGAWPLPLSLPPAIPAPETCVFRTSRECPTHTLHAFPPRFQVVSSSRRSTPGIYMAHLSARSFPRRQSLIHIGRSLSFSAPALSCFHVSLLPHHILHILLDVTSRKLSPCFLPCLSVFLSFFNKSTPLCLSIHSSSFFNTRCVC
jgi:hypothetical protein